MNFRSSAILRARSSRRRPQGCGNGVCPFKAAFPCGPLRSTGTLAHECCPRRQLLFRCRLWALLRSVCHPRQSTPATRPFARVDACNPCPRDPSCHGSGNPFGARRGDLASLPVEPYDRSSCRLTARCSSCSGAPNRPLWVHIHLNYC